MSVRLDLGSALIGLVLVACTADAGIGSSSVAAGASTSRSTSATTTTKATDPGEPSTTAVDLLDGSRLEVVGPSELQLTGYSFTFEVPEIRSSNVDLSRGVDPNDPGAVDEAAVLESNLGDGVRLWHADREGHPFYMSVDLGGWVAFLHVGNARAPDTELLLSLADQLRGEGSEDGVVLANYEPDFFTTYLSVPNTGNQVDLAANQCVQEIVPGAVVVEDPTRGEVVRGSEYASWCDEEADIQVTAYGDSEFVERVLDEMTLSRTQSTVKAHINRIFPSCTSATEPRR